MWKTCLVQLLIACAITVGKEEIKVTTEFKSARSPGARIIGGAATTIQKYPFAVQIIYKGELYCGGALITRRHVLSAAHCFFDVNGRLYYRCLVSVRVGATYRNRGADACHGDSGGPQLHGGALVGLTSWGYGCAEPRYPGVAVLVARYTSWINDTS
ncbi:trypsin I-P1-like [Epargyreus clarus]|uniref:trypsin I-P1-like n=1 Tax=Epargyreus clarus TaxID=520877 RepID=UPI003C30287A